MGKDDVKSATSSQSRGIIYVAFGEAYVLQAMHSIKTLRAYCPRLPVLVVHNCAEEIAVPRALSSEFCEFRKVDAANSLNREFKSSVHRHSPFERTLFLDCDTEIKGDVSKGFDFLDHADLALRPEPAPYAMSVTEKDPEEAEMLTHFFGEFNTGVIFFRRSPEALQVLDAWHENVVKNNKRDQKHFVRAISSCPQIVIWPLSAAWNYMRYDVRTHARSSLLRKDPFVWHYMDYSYSPPALLGVWEMAKATKKTDVVANWPYLKRHILRPFLTRYAFLKFVDKVRSFPRRLLSLIKGSKI